MNRLLSSIFLIFSTFTFQEAFAIVVTRPATVAEKAPETL